MPVRIICPNCGAAYRYPEDRLGRNVQCAKCKQMFLAKAAEPIQEVVAADAPTPSWEQIQTSPGRVPPPLVAINKPAAEPAKSSALGPVLIAAAVVVPVLLVAGGVLAWLMIAQQDRPAPVAQALPSGNLAPAQPLPANPPVADPAPMANPPVVVEQPVANPPPAEPVNPPPPVPAQPVVIPPPDPPTIKPAVVGDGKVERPLPGPIGEVVAGGGGRYLIFHIPKLRQLAVFDVNEAKVVKYLPVPEDNVKIAAGASKLMVMLCTNNIIQRWNLQTFERELSANLPITGVVKTICMGANSNGPLLVHWAKGTGALDQAPTSYLDIQSLKLIDYQGEGGRGSACYRDHMHYRASADGQTFGVWATSHSPGGLGSIVLTGGKAQGYYDHTTVGHIVPSADGKLLFTASGIYTNQVKALGTQQTRIFCLPAVMGNYYLALSGGPIAREQQPASVAVHMMGDNRPLLHLPNLLEGFTGFDPWGRQEISPDKRIWFIPQAQLIVTLPPTNDKLVLHPFNVESALEKAGVDYLLVTSQPPGQAVKGKPYSYQVVAKAKKGPAKFRLESGPQGMAVSPTGLVSWDVPASFPEAEAVVIITVADTAGQETFHTFKVGFGVAAGEMPAVAIKPPDLKPDLPADPAPAPPNPAKPDTPPPDPVPVKPPTLAQDKVVKQLPSTIADAVVGGGGRFIILHLPKERKLAVFDVNEAKIATYLAVPEDNIRFTAGMDKLFVVMADSRIIQRWSLTTFARELSITLPVQNQVTALAMGSASNGPLLVSAGQTFFMDIRTMKPLALQQVGQDRIGGIGPEDRVRVSADGRVFGTWRTQVSPQGIQTHILVGNQIHTFYEHDSAGHIVPGPDGKYIYTGRGIFTSQVKAVGKAGRQGGNYVLPSVNGNYYLTVNLGDRFGIDKTKQSTLSVHLVGDERPLINLTNIELPDGANQWGREPFGFDRRILFIPSAQVIITIPTTNDRLIVHRFNIEQALEKAGIDYLIVTSNPPGSVKRGEALSYQMVVKSKQGGVKYKVESGPKGMTVSPTGLVSWKALPVFTQREADVIISVTDKSGQEIFHTFKVAISP